MENLILRGSNIDTFKHRPKLADINLNKVLKKKSLLEEIQGTSRDSYSRGAGYREAKPIIVVPSSSEYPGNICLKNAVQFLKDGKYVLPQDVQQSTEEKYASKRTFEKQIGNDHVTFEVYDSVHGFTKKEWSRVVCLFTHGEEFQLKDWPNAPEKEVNMQQKDKQMAKTVNLFYRVKGFYLRY